MSKRTRWFAVEVVVALRNQERVQYAQDDIKTETRPGVRDHSFLVLLEADEGCQEEDLQALIQFKIARMFCYQPRLEDEKPRTFEIKKVTFKKVDAVFRAVSEL